MGVDTATFRDARRVAILPLGFCCPGTGKSGDLPPRPEWAAPWRENPLAALGRVQLTLLVGQFAQAWHLGEAAKPTLTATVQARREHWLAMLPLPHPSPRNNIWLRRNPWFDAGVLPRLRRLVREVIGL